MTERYVGPWVQAKRVSRSLPPGEVSLGGYLLSRWEWPPVTVLSTQKLVFEQRGDKARVRVEDDEDLDRQEKN